MKFYKSHDNNRKFKIHVKGIQFEFNEQLDIHQSIKELLESAPDDSRVELKIQYEANTFKARLEIFGPLFGCHVNSSSNKLNDAISKVFNSANQEIDIWRSNPTNQNIFATYIGGYPSYYKELTV